jgi:chemotaxis protein MotB
MAFFLVMWLVAAANDSQKSAIFEYFKNPSMERGVAPIAAPGQDGPGGASTSPIELRGGLTASAPSPIAESGAGTPSSPGPRDELRAPRALTGETSETKRFQEIRKELLTAIEKNETLQKYREQLLIDITSEGLRIQIVDAQNRPMFDLSGTAIKPYARELLLEVGKSLEGVPNRLSISGHTDDTPFVGSARSRYSNWELSADRANAARRVLVDGGIGEDKVARVIGMSSHVLLDARNPSNPINRRISIVVLNKATEEALNRSDTFIPRPTTAAPMAPPSS